MELRHLRTFVVIADAGGFSNAARRLHLTQPALSRQIRVLEHELGTRLFARGGRTVEVTEAGIDLLRHARTILADADSLRDRARALVSGDVGVLRVGTTPQTLEAVLAPFVGGYRRRHPGVSVHFTEDGGVALLGYLERGQVQLTVTIAGDDRFRHRALFPALILAVMPATHRLHRRLAVEVTDLKDEDLLLLKPGFVTRRLFDGACQVARCHPRTLIESAAPAALIALAAAGYGVAIVPSNIVFPRRGLHAVPVVQRGAALGARVAASWNPRRFLPAYGEAFIEELAAHTRKVYPGRDLARGLAARLRQRAARGADGRPRAGDSPPRS